MTKAAGTSRRTVVAAAGAAGLAVALTACGSGDSEAKAESPADGGGQKEQSQDNGGSGAALAKASDIPVGGGRVFKDQKVVVTQPKANEFKAFSATCTHQGCLVNEVAAGTINCPCHQSKFKIEDGSVAGGPATSPLEERTVSVEGGSIKIS